jgi:hypothetical protein
MLNEVKHLDSIGFETLHYVQGDDWNNFSEVSLCFGHGILLCFAAMTDLQICCQSN